jgi:tetratricopeptide (TPR) repeat protein
LEDNLNHDPNDNFSLFILGKKYLDRGNSELSKKYFNQFIYNSPEGMEANLEEAHFLLSKADWDNGEISGLENFIINYPDSKDCLSAYQLISRYYITTHDTISEINTLKKMVEVFPNNANAMNSYAWRMVELNTNLIDALEKAKKGVELADDDSKSMILDTQAEIEWMLDDVESAINTIKKAIKLNPEDSYYQSQLGKFEN